MKSNIEIVKEWVDASNSHDVNRIIDLLSPDYEYQFSESILKGLDTIRQGWQYFFDAFPDFHYEIEQIFEHEDYVVSRERMTGTQKGPFKFVGINSVEKPLPPNNKRMDIPSCSIHKIKDGKITHLWRYWDSAALLRQLS